MAKEKDYEVGYGKPPKHTQFEKGRSGNPSGKRKKPISDDDLILREMMSKVSVMEGGKEKRISKLEAIIKKQALLAMKGDPKAVRFVVDAYNAAAKKRAAEEGGEEEVYRVTLVFDEEEERRRQIEEEKYPNEF